MSNFKLTIEYDGTNFQGWQAQAKNLRTVQGEIEKALKIIFKKKINVIGSGRTDSGVHALAQVANFRAEAKHPKNILLRALNANLPEDIAIIKVENVNDNFHAQYAAKSKIYRYTILNRQSPSPFRNKYSLFYPYELNLKLMREEAKVLKGRHDFKSFQASDPKRKIASTMRAIKNISLKKLGDIIEINIEADGFLYKMVRNIVGTLLEIGRGALPKGAIKSILKKRNRIYAGYTVKPQGLCLIKVNY